MHHFDLRDLYFEVFVGFQRKVFDGRPEFVIVILYLDVTHVENPALCIDVIIHHKRDD